MAYLLCPKHNRQLVLIHTSIAASRHTFVLHKEWTYYTCPVVGCGYMRANKAPARRKEKWVEEETDL